MGRPCEITVIIMIIIIVIIIIIIIIINLIINLIHVKNYSVKALFTLFLSNFFFLKRHLISIEKIHSIKDISYIRKKIQLKNGSFQLN